MQKLAGCHYVRIIVIHVFHSIAIMRYFEVLGANFETGDGYRVTCIRLSAYSQYARMAIDRAQRSRSRLDEYVASTNNRSNNKSEIHTRQNTKQTTCTSECFLFLIISSQRVLYLGTKCGSTSRAELAS